ncbi:M20 metallopeptidase family protein [Desulforhopalus sp. 52FAK]
MGQNISFSSVDDNLLDWMRNIRRHLHQYPELSFKEHNTSAFIQAKLIELGVPFRGGVGGTGVIATLGEADATLSHVGLRADMDALPVEEKNEVSYASKIPGVMHACGHDGHVAMLLGATALLKKHGCKNRVSCIFQPAEEHGNGAEKMIKEGALADGVQVVFGGHIDTHFSTGVITVDEGVICSYADPFSIRILGQSGHAARPHEAKDSLVAGAYLATALQTLISRETDPNQAAVLTLGRFAAGTAHNIIADEALIDGTLRSTQTELRDRLIAALQRMTRSISDQFGVVASIQFHDCLPAVINSTLAATIARQAAQVIVGREQVVSQGKPSLGAEDFSFYQQQVDGCLVRFGANSLNENSPAHSGTFDFDETVLGIGADWLARVAMEWPPMSG